MFCGKCERPYSSLETSRQLPRVLACGHSYCTECLESCFKQQDAPSASIPVPCASCLQTTLCRSMDDLAIHHTLCARIQQIFQRLDPPVPVKEEEAKDDDLQLETKEKQTQFVKCPKHVTMTQEWFCKTCQQLVCLYCRDTQHKNGHEWVPAQDEWNQMQTRKHEEMQQVLHTKRVWEQWHTKIETLDQRLESQYLQRMRQLDAQEREWMQAIRARKQVLCQQLNEQHVQDVQSARRTKTRVQQRIREIEQLSVDWKNATSFTTLPLVSAWMQQHKDLQTHLLETQEEWISRTHQTELVAPRISWDEWKLAYATPPTHIVLSPECPSSESKGSSVANPPLAWPHVATLRNVCANALRLTWVLPKDWNALSPTTPSAVQQKYVLQSVQTEIQLGLVQDKEWEFIGWTMIGELTKEEKWKTWTTTSETSVLLKRSDLRTILDESRNTYQYYQVVLVRMRLVYRFVPPPFSAYGAVQEYSAWSPVVSHSIPWTLRQDLNLCTRSPKARDASLYQTWHLVCTERPLLSSQLWKLRVLSYSEPKTLVMGLCHVDEYLPRDPWGNNGRTECIQVDPSNPHDNSLFRFDDWKVQAGDELWVHFQYASKQLVITRVSSRVSSSTTCVLLAPSYTEGLNFFVASKGTTKFEFLKDE